VGREQVWIVDPATPYDDQRAVMLEAVAEEKRAGRTPVGIVLTHHHHDHIGGAAWLREQTDLQIWAHPRTASLLEGTLRIDETLDEGDVLVGSEVGEDDRWRVFHTPGHASGHLVLFEPTTRALIAGDMVAGVGTILVEPPDGDMARYIQELERLLALEPRLAVPAHGELIREPMEVLQHYITHRLAREAKVLAAVGTDERALIDVTRVAYQDVPASLHALAARSTLAHLIKLEAESRVQRSASGGWRRTQVPAETR